MKVFVIILFFCSSVGVNAQAPPVIEWQKCIGGSAPDGFSTIVPTVDGGFLACGATISVDGDIGSNHGMYDVFFMKLDASGNIQWRRVYGGSRNDLPGASNCLQPTADGGYVFIGSSGSDDGDVSGHHAGITAADAPDVWIVKLNSNGFIEWQQSYGGPYGDYGSSIFQATDGGYVIGASTQGNGGDVLGWHGSNHNFGDYWILRINSTGVIQWQKTVGGSTDEGEPLIGKTNDGGFILCGFTNSPDGDITCLGASPSSIWIGKFDGTGNLQWQKCHAGNFLGWPFLISQTSDGGFITIGMGWYVADPPLPGAGELYAYAEKLDQNGNLSWHRDFGGSYQENIVSVKQTSDGGFILAGHTGSTDGDICTNKGQYDAFIVKLKADGSTEWKKTYGGSLHDGGSCILPTSDGGYILAGNTQSADGDVVGNTIGDRDAWLVKLNFPGIPVLPTISIMADKTSICSGQSVRVVATITDGGTAPIFQWTLNGVVTGPNNDTIFLSTLGNGDIINCILTSNSPCVTERTAISNSISITVDPLLTPQNFLLPGAEICKYGTLTLSALNSFDSYMWSTSASTPTITINSSGKFWLNVIKGGCPGTDTIMVTEKQCLQGFFMPTAFTPNNDGRNDVLKPLVAGTLLQYKFSIYNRWGQLIFQSSNASGGWDGKINGVLQDGNNYIWTCRYQLAGEEIKNAKGTFVLIK